MADTNLKKVVIKQKDLPPITKNNQYYFRYRIINEDGTITSEWSDKYVINNNLIYDVVSNSIVSVRSAQASDLINMDISWKLPEYLIGVNFDVFVSWSYTDTSSGSFTPFSLYTTSNSNSVKVTIPYNDLSVKAKYMKATVQFESVNHEISSDIKIFDIGPVTTSYVLPAISLDGGQI